MYSINTIKNTRFGEIRVITINDDIYFVASDVAKIWRHSNFTQAIKRYLSDSDYKKIDRSANKEESEMIKTYCEHSKYVCKINQLMLLTYDGLKKMTLSTQKLYEKNDFIQWVAKEVNITTENQYTSVRKELSFTHILEPMCKELGYIVTKQQPVGKYKLDFYIFELNVAVEFDETHHLYKIDEDKERQEYIANKIGCKFIRIKENESIGEQLAYLSYLLIKNMEEKNIYTFKFADMLVKEGHDMSKVIRMNNLMRPVIESLNNLGIKITDK